MADRIADFVAALHVRPSEHILEIGCGHGVAASLICDALGASGRYIAIDRSPTMIRLAQQRNARFVAAGTAQFLLGALESVDLGARRFDKVIAMRVGLFHREPARAEALVRRWLAPRGRLFVQYDEPVPQRAPSARQR
jgi:ubiquinone/menaquinone biosynthesis C-methylase UbiE